MMQSHLMTEEHHMFRDAVKAFVQKELAPREEEWCKNGIVSRDVWLKAGEQGMLCMDFPEKYGGMGIKDFRYNAILVEEIIKANVTSVGFFLQNDIMAPYFTQFCNDEQKARWMPKVASGEYITALCMTEPSVGSDVANVSTSAVKKGDKYVINGQKTFITNGINCDLAIVVAKTDPSAGHKGITLFMVEEGMKGFIKGKNLDKIGLHGQDTSELFFEDVEVPEENILAEVGKGFYYLMHNLPQERLSIAVSAVASCEVALEWTIQYCKDRKAFGQSIGSFQNSKFKLAEMRTEITIARTFVDQCILELNAKKLSPEKAAMAKYWTTELQIKVVNQCLQLHGGYGYMNEFPIAKMYVDCRIQTIYGGTNEIMREIIGRSMGF
ncbi:MAG: acyl-CoA dehydrogenase family protein [Saprospiraceae bacterium]